MSCPPTPPRGRRAVLLALLPLAALSLGACATLHAVDIEVSSHGVWPAGRAPGSYAIERLPSQQSDLPRQQALEDAARPALAAAGFREVPPEQAELLVQLGLLSQQVLALDPFYPDWGGPFYPYAGAAGWPRSSVYVGGWPHVGRRSSIGLGFHYSPEPPRTLREVALLIRDKGSQAVIHESRARLSGGGSDRVLSLMFEAALKDFPGPAPSPRTVRLQLPPH